MPVKLLLGRAMLLTRPSFTGSWLAMKTVWDRRRCSLGRQGSAHSPWKGYRTKQPTNWSPLCRGRPQCGLDFSPLGCRRQSQHQIEVSSWLMSAYWHHAPLHRLV